MHRFAIIVTALCGAAFGIPASRDLVVHEAISSVPRGFSTGTPASRDLLLNLRFALAQNNMNGLEQVLYDISTPASDMYGKHLTLDELSVYVKPTTHTSSLVTNWLSSNQLAGASVTFSGDIVEVSMPVYQANELLNADFQVFTEHSSGRQSVRTLSYSIPPVLKGHLHHVHPTVSFDLRTVPIPDAISARSQSSSNSTSIPSSCHSATTPACIQDLYGIPKTLATQSENKLFVSGFGGEYANNLDLVSFLTTYRPDMSPNTTFSVVSVNGGINDQKASIAGKEANLDIQYTVGLASGVPTSYVTVGPQILANSTEFYHALQDEANYILKMDKPPTVLTSSYSNTESSMSRSLAKTICNLYMQLGARGVSVLFSSGDSGVGESTYDCPNSTPFVPTFPGVCPYITSVGGTQLESAGTKEKAATFGGDGSSGGGFSNYFPTPAYQSAEVSAYLKTLGSTYSGRYNSSGRGFPDVSALGVNCTVESYPGYTRLENGTSCSTPIFASVVALLNDRRIAAGMPPLGFLNPLLYSSNGTKALRDVTTGSNPGCDTKGFSAGAGWDPVTGLGTPIFSKLLAAVMV
ncbi:family S53 protease [Athelia psychrophila]|uniref:tripeptidyl-peptidase II n=1 Tax=Athelia psychrophila TaxID=1759441 RepID=A0A166SGR7_9AGAM|nr:family S53 protease [Fibularhizoctonia sp. CBS 109695]